MRSVENARVHVDDGELDRAIKMMSSTDALCSRVAAPPRWLVAPLGREPVALRRDARGRHLAPPPSAAAMPPRRWDMGGLRCIVTGGSKGLGRACVEEFLELGAFVLFTARGADELARVATELRGQYNDDDVERVYTLAADVSTAAGRDAPAPGARWSCALIASALKVFKQRKIRAIRAKFGPRGWTVDLNAVRER